jgi:hypothetical protein
MKSKLVDTVASNEEHVRLRIFEGDLPADEATAELLRLEREQHAETRRKLAKAQKRLKLLDALEAGGVDNWEWYGEACSEAYGDEDDDEE